MARRLPTVVAATPAENKPELKAVEKRVRTGSELRSTQDPDKSQKKARSIQINAEKNLQTTEVGGNEIKEQPQQPGHEETPSSSIERVTVSVPQSTLAQKHIAKIANKLNKSKRYVEQAAFKKAKVTVEKELSNPRSLEKERINLLLFVQERLQI